LGQKQHSDEYFLDSEHFKVCSFSTTVLLEERKSLQIFWEISRQLFPLIFFEEGLNPSLTRVTFPWYVPTPAKAINTEFFEQHSSIG